MPQQVLPCGYFEPTAKGSIEDGPSSAQLVRSAHSQCFPTFLSVSPASKLPSPAGHSSYSLHSPHQRSCMGSSMRIKASLQCLHHADGLEAQFIDEALLFTQADAVFTGTRTFLPWRIVSMYLGRMPGLEISGEVLGHTISSARLTMLCTTCSTCSLSLGSLRL